MRVRLTAAVRRAAAGSLVAGLVMLLPSTGGWSALSCTCRYELVNRPPCASYWEADAVFVGRVTGISVRRGAEKYEQKAVRFAVDEVFRGVSKRTVVVWTGLGSADCGYPFEKGKRYFVYASRGDDGLLHESICGGTDPMDQGADDLAYARAASKGQNPSGAFGQVYRITGDTDWRTMGVYDPVVGARVTLIGSDAQPHVATTDSDGRFHLEGLGAGEYTVRLEVLSEIVDERKAIVTAGRCTQVDIGLRPPGRAAGK